MVKLWVIDVDGTLTDAGIYYDNKGNELKKFCTKDAAGIFAAHQCGMKVMVLTGRESSATTRRMMELKVDFIYQNIKNKVNSLLEYQRNQHFSRGEIAYIGDDLNDLSAMKLCGYVGCPKDSCEEVKAMASYVSPVLGGHGAVRDVIEHYLRENGLWESAVEEIYGVGI